MGKTIAKKNYLTIHERCKLIDFHVHPALKTYLFCTKFYKRHKAGGAWNPLRVRVDLPKLTEGGVNGIFSAIYCPEKEMLDDCMPLRMAIGFLGLFSKKFRGISKGNRFDETMKMIDSFENTVSSAVKKGFQNVKIARSRAEFEEFLDKGKLTIVHSIEGGHSLGGKLENLEKFFNRGVALLTLAHFYENEIGQTVGGIIDSKKMFGCFKHSVIQEGGLSDFGRDVVEEMIRMGMLIDMTHCTLKARQEIFEINNNRRPLICSHVGVQARFQHPINLTDDDIKKIAGCGGTICVIFMNHWLSEKPQKDGLDLIVKTIEHIRKKTGTDFISVGTDFDGFTDPPDDIKDIAEMPKFTESLLKAGFKETDIEKILGENALRVIRAGWGGETGPDHVSY